MRDTLYREYKRFGEISVKVVQELDERVAYVYFRSYEDARDAKHSKSRIIIYDRPVMVEAAYESGSSSSTNNNYRQPESSRDSFPGPERPERGGGSYYSRRYFTSNTNTSSNNNYVPLVHLLLKVKGSGASTKHKLQQIIWCLFTFVEFSLFFNISFIISLVTITFSKFISTELANG